MKWFYGIMVVLALALCSSCRTVQPVVVTHTIHDTINNNTIVHDSVYVSVDKWRSNDTVYLDKFTYKYKFIHDSIYVSKVDSIPIIKEVEIPTYKHGFMWYSGLALWIIIAVIIVAVVGGIFIKFAK